MCFENSLRGKIICNLQSIHLKQVNMIHTCQELENQTLSNLFFVKERALFLKITSILKFSLREPCSSFSTSLSRVRVLHLVDTILN